MIEQTNHVSLSGRFTGRGQTTVVEGNRPHWTRCESTVRVLEFHADPENLIPWPDCVVPSVHISRSFDEILEIAFCTWRWDCPKRLLDVKGTTALPSHDPVFPEWIPLHGWDDEDDIGGLRELGSVIGQRIPRARLLPLRFDGTLPSGDD
jgi:hypothetical protein